MENNEENNEIDCYVLMYTDESSRLWIESKQNTGQLINIGGNEAIEVIFDPRFLNLMVCYRFKLRKSKVDLFRLELEALNAEIIESAEEYKQRFYNSQNPI